MEKNTASASHEQEFANNQNAYFKKIHLIGTVSMWTLLVVTFTPAIYVFLAKDAFPGWGVLAQIAGTMVAKGVTFWILEPTMYFPLVGIAGLYLSFTAGNCLSMRVPCSLAAQNAVNAENGTPRGDAIGLFGMISSVVVNLVVLMVVIFMGDVLLNMLPENIRLAFNYAMPAVYGSMIVMFLGSTMKKKKKPEDKTAEAGKEAGK